MKNYASLAGAAIIDFVPDPSKSVATFTDTSKTIDTTSILALRLRGTAGMTYYFNSDTTKTYPVDAEVETIVNTRNSAVLQVVILNASTGTVSIQGM